MVRRLAPLLAVAALACAALAPAASAGPSDVHTFALGVTGAPGVPGAPQPVGLDLFATTISPQGWRATTTDTLTYDVRGVQLGDAGRAGCDPARLSDAANVDGTAVCPAGALVGTAELTLAVGPPSDPTSRDLYCFLSGTLVASTTPGELLVWLRGGPRASADPTRNCVQDTHEAVSATVRTDAGGSTLTIALPANLRHPAGGALDTAFERVGLSFSASGYAQATSCPTATLALHREDGTTATPAAAPPACAPPVTGCPAGTVGTPPTCPWPTGPQPVVPVRISVPRTCVRGAFTATVRRTASPVAASGLVLRLDGRRLKALTRLPARVTVPKAKLRRTGTHTLTVTATAGTDGAVARVQTTFRVCAPKKHR
jgi:hypothetical protein